METNENFLTSFWKSVDFIYSNNHKEGMKLRELVEIIIKHQKQLKGKKIEFRNMSPYDFQLISTFKRVVLNENKFQVIVNWHNKKRIGAEFNLKNLDVLVNEKCVMFEDRKKYMAKKIIIFLND